MFVTESKNNETPPVSNVHEDQISFRSNKHPESTQK